MSEFYDVVDNRRSCRSFTKEVPDHNAVARIIHAGLVAPSGKSLQSPIFLVFKGEKRNLVSYLNARVMGNISIDPFYGAPVVIAVLADKRVNTHVYDGSVSLAQMLLAAEEEGLGAIWIHRAKEVFESKEGKRILADLDLDPELYEGVGNCALGYWSKEKPEAHPLKENRVFYVED